MPTTDFFIIGVGVVGLTVARELKLRYPDQGIRAQMLDKKIGKIGD